MKNFIFLILLMSTFFKTYSQNNKFQTLILDSLTTSPIATISEIDWIAGHWQGKAFGGIVEENWTPPLGKSMMGAFKLVVNNKVKFYEILIITEESNTLILRLKHFHHDLKGWEEKDETIEFPLVKVTENKVFFDGFTFEKVNINEINIFVRIGNENEIKELKFNYNRVQ